MAEREVIILNKIFEGAWNEEEGNISHEIIDFVLDDNKKHYVYNTPYGVCPDYIYVGTKNPSNKKETHKATYLLLTGTTREDKNNDKYSFPINYCIKLKEKIHSCHKPKEDETLLDEYRNEIIGICKRKEIKYNGRFLHEIYKNDKSLLLTFEAEKMWKAKQPIEVSLKYNFKRNKGYVTNDSTCPKNKKYGLSDDYKILYNKITDTDLWEEFELKKIDISASPKKHSEKSFLDLILKVDSEECYTNILYSVLKHKNLLLDFCNRYKKNEWVVSEEDFAVFREQGVVEGRMDVCAESNNQRVVVENKVFSGLNGYHKDDETQLSKYHNWAAEKDHLTPLCFITAPDHRIDEIKAEIKVKDSKMANNYKIIGYSEIVEFLKENINTLKSDYDFAKYADDFIYIFNHHAHKSKQEYYKNLFLNAIIESQ